MLILVSGSTATVRRLVSRCPRFGHLLTPNNRNSVASLLKTGLPWAIDNGAFSGFDPESFQRLLGRAEDATLPSRTGEGPSAGGEGSVAREPLWVVCPDVVADARGTLALWPWWSALIRSRGFRAAFVLQDGQEDEPLPDADAFFIGGSTEWKLSRHAADLGLEAKRRGKWLHMGRVNSLRRLQTAMDMGCDSVDGSSLSMFGDKYIHKFCSWAIQLHQQPTLFGAGD